MNRYNDTVILSGKLEFHKKKITSVGVGQRRLEGSNYDVVCMQSLLILLIQQKLKYGF